MKHRQSFGRDLIAAGHTVDAMDLPIDPNAIYDVALDGKFRRCGLWPNAKKKKP